MNPPSQAQDWETFLSGHPEAHILQTAAWGTLKSSYGWQVEHVVQARGGAQVLFRRLRLGASLAYIPRGPVGAWLPDLLPALDDLCRRRGAFTLKVEPDEPWSAEGANMMQAHGFQQSPQSVQPPRTLVVSLEGDEDEILARMHSKTRYNIRLSGRKDVTVRPWADLAAFGGMMQSTAARQEFGAHVPAYYQLAYELFHPRGECELFVAEHEGAPLAALMVFARGSRAWYFYGASTTRERNRMPTYLLQWEAIRWAKSKGCAIYDLWGVPDASLDKLEAEFAGRSDGLWGVYRFKRGFGGELERSTGAWDRPYNPLLYRLYRVLAPRAAG